MTPLVQLELDLSTTSAPQPSVAEELALVRQEYADFRRAHFEFHSEVSRDIRALKKENAELKSQACAHPRIFPGLDRAHCADCQKDFTPRTAEYKSLMALPQHAPANDVSGATPTITAPDETSQAPANDVSGATPTITAPDETSQTRQIHWTEIYCPARRKEHQYYRYVWMDKRRLRHRHIPGGNISSGTARLNFLEVEGAIAQGRTSAEIETLIKTWGGGRGKKA